jgi:hypothetical protein
LIEGLYQAGLADAALCNDEHHAGATESAGRWVTCGARFKQAAKLCELYGAAVKIMDGWSAQSSTPRGEIDGTYTNHVHTVQG